MRADLPILIPFLAMALGLGACGHERAVRSGQVSQVFSANLPIAELSSRKIDHRGFKS